jgi:hypothetical protein
MHKPWDKWAAIIGTRCLNIIGHYLGRLHGLARARREKGLYSFHNVGVRPRLIIHIWDMLPTWYLECQLQHIFMFNMQGPTSRPCHWVGYALKSYLTRNTSGKFRNDPYCSKQPRQSASRFKQVQKQLKLIKNNSDRRTNNSTRR